MKFIALLMLLATSLTPLRAEEMGDYKLGPDDEISVTVFGEPDLSLAKAKISTSGTISMPLIGQVTINGMTIAEVEQKVTQLFLGDYLKKPNVTVSVVEYRQFYVNGEVKKPGGYSYREGMTIQKAVTLAGGFTERASRTSIRLVRESKGTEPTKVKLTDGVKPGDVITVDESFF